MTVINIRSRSRWLGALAAVVPAALLLAGLVSAAPASAGTLPNGGTSGIPTIPGASLLQPIYGYGGMCVDLSGGIAANYQPVLLYPCTRNANQQWSYNYADGSIISAIGVNMCLDVYAGGLSNGSPVDLYQCNGTGAQQWIMEPGGGLRNPQSGLYLDDPRFSTNPNGTQLNLWAGNGGANQVWQAFGN